jgi:hypothetical protein
MNLIAERKSLGEEKGKGGKVVQSPGLASRPTPTFPARATVPNQADALGGKASRVG